MIVTTPRLVLRPFTDMDRAPFFALNTHPLVVEALGQSPTRAKSDQLVDTVNEELSAEGFGLWAVEARIGMHRDADGDFDHPSLPEGDPLLCHVLYRIVPSQLPPTVAA